MRGDETRFFFEHIIIFILIDVQGHQNLKYFSAVIIFRKVIVVLCSTAATVTLEVWLFLFVMYCYYVFEANLAGLLQRSFDCCYYLAESEQLDL